MAKPSVTLRQTKGSALSYTELDQNFTNLRDATLTLTADTGGTAVSADLNGTITLVAGTNVTITGDNTAKTITINSSAGGSGTVNSGTAGRLAFYPSTGTTVDDTSAISIDSGTGYVVLGADIDVNGKVFRNNAGNIEFNDDILFLNNNDGIVGQGTIKIRNRVAEETNIVLTTTNITMKSDSFEIGEADANDCEIKANTATSSKAIKIIGRNGSADGGFLTIGGAVTLGTADLGSQIIMNSTTKLISITSTQRSTYDSFMADGTVIYNSTDNKFQGKANGSWVDLH